MAVTLPKTLPLFRALYSALGGQSLVDLGCSCNRLQGQRDDTADSQECGITFALVSFQSSAYCCGARERSHGQEADTVDGAGWT